MTYRGIYAGIGPRDDVPMHILDLMNMIAVTLAQRGYMLRSGRARGCDTAFEAGARSVGGPIDTFDAGDADKRAHWFTHARKYHMGWPHLNRDAQRLLARNSAVICGANLQNPVDAVITWTPNGIVGPTGGTGHALRIAHAHKIPVYNLGRDWEAADLWRWLGAV